VSERQAEVSVVLADSTWRDEISFTPPRSSSTVK
jgi:hypothetical protein